MADETLEVDEGAGPHCCGLSGCGHDYKRPRLIQSASQSLNVNYAYSENDVWS